ncbi:MAG TPA: M14 family zinc carboxypeptidase, partial [Ferruginibacter sp.]|nr:M14 family zinc carboxypeptidase [Ferruginibacter sp.]
QVLVKEMGMTDAGYPLHLVLVSKDGKFDPGQWHKQNKVVVLINNGIHPGEPDGIDASMMFVRDIVIKKISLPDNVALAFIPVYNIGGCLNRNSYSRANQDGPLEYGFRGNAQNLDLNRDFTKCDSKEARSFARLFHWLDPEILVDNHVSDGADYQHTMTMLTSQYDKLGAGLGGWLRDTFEPRLYNGMRDKKWDMVPYVSFETGSPDKGMMMFYDPPRYSSGYAALFQTIGFVPETHMLKPFKDRVLSTYAFSQTIIEQASEKAGELIEERKKAKAAVRSAASFPLRWSLDTSHYSFVTFKGYEQAYKPSDATGLNRMVGLGYAVPGTVIAVGVLIPVTRLDNWLAGQWEAWFGTNPGLLLTGGIAALIYAYLARFLSVALQTVDASLAKITPSMDDAARSL